MGAEGGRKVAIVEVRTSRKGSLLSNSSPAKGQCPNVERGNALPQERRGSGKQSTPLLRELSASLFGWRTQANRGLQQRQSIGNPGDREQPSPEPKLTLRELHCRGTLATRPRPSAQPPDPRVISREELHLPWQIPPDNPPSLVPATLMGTHRPREGSPPGCTGCPDTVAGPWTSPRTSAWPETATPR